MMQQDGMFSLQGSRHYYHHSRVSRTILGGAVLKSSVNTLEMHLFFSIQLVHRSHFGTGIFLFGPLSSKGKKVDLRNSEQLLRVVFSTFCGQNKI